MIISRTPLRLSFAGGGSDLPAYYQHSPGAVVSTTINKYIYIMVNKKFDGRIRASYSLTENVDTVAEIKHGLIREALRYIGVWSGIEVASISDIPGGTGLGSSSAYTVGLLNALYAYVGQEATPEELAAAACRIEIGVLGEPIGKQDQYAAAYGGLRRYVFSKDHTAVSGPIGRTIMLQRGLLLFYTGTQREASSILTAQSAATTTDPAVRVHIEEMVRMAEYMSDALVTGTLMGVALGALLDTGWMLKKKMAEGISTPQIDAWYDTARAAGATGGKIAGAGAGGFLLLAAPPYRHAAIIAALPELRHVPFQFEPQGSTIIYRD